MDRFEVSNTVYLSTKETAHQGLWKWNYLYYDMVRSFICYERHGLCMGISFDKHKVLTKKKIKIWVSFTKLESTHQRLIAFDDVHKTNMSHGWFRSMKSGPYCIKSLFIIILRHFFHDVTPMEVDLQPAKVEIGWCIMWMD